MSSEIYERRNAHSKVNSKLRREYFKSQENNSSGYASDESFIEASVNEGNATDSMTVDQHGDIGREQPVASNESIKNGPNTWDEDAHTTNDLDRDEVYTIVSSSASEETKITLDEQCRFPYTCNDEYSIKCSEMRRNLDQRDNDENLSYLTGSENNRETDNVTGASRQQSESSQDVIRVADSSQDVSRHSSSSRDVSREADSSHDVRKEACSSQKVSKEADSGQDVRKQAYSSRTDVSRQARSDKDVSTQARSDTGVSRQAYSDTDVSRQAGIDMDVSRDAVCDMVVNSDVEHMKNLEEDTDSIADGDDYRVQQKEIEELEIVETHRPCLYSQKSTISTTSSQQNKVKVEKTHSDVVDSSKAERSERQRFKIEVS